MSWRSRNCSFLVYVALAVVFFAGALAHADQWTAPTAEELSMTSLPQAPGASAVYLFREENQDDHLHVYSEYVRLKVLTDGGKDMANVELPYLTGSEHNAHLSEIAGRTIHPDGTIVPFTGKPYDKMVVKTQGFQYNAKVFTLPDVTVGSIIEYRYKILLLTYTFSSPDWIVQGDTYLRKAHFLWRTTEKPLTTSDERGQVVSAVAWLPILPPGVHLNQSTAGGDGSSLFELDVQDVPAAPEEEFMPPRSSLGYRVMFFYSPYKTADEFWREEGKHWSKIQDKFIGPGPAVRAAVQQLAAPTDTQEQKLKKIYAAVEQLDNTDYSRRHSQVEDKAEGLSEVRTADDIWTHRRGSSNQIALLFIAMARAAGMKAYALGVTDRSRTIFLKGYLSTSQLQDVVAIVSVDGKEQAFDPGSRYCPYGHLAWTHTETGALRQTDGATALIAMPGESYSASGVNRVANLQMDETGTVTGKVDLKFTGASALQWRHDALRNDRESLERKLKENVEQMLPGGMEVKLLSIGKLEEYEEPLTVALEVKGPIGSATGKRLLLPGDLFESNEKAAFPHDKRELPVWFSYRYTSHDAVRIGLPEGFQVESLPPEASVKLPKMAYILKATTDSASVTVHRDLYLADIFFTPDKYADLRTFYTQFEAKDQEPIVLKTAAAAPSGN